MSKQTTIPYGNNTLLFNEDSPRNCTEGLSITRLTPSKKSYYLFDENSIMLGQPFFAINERLSLSIFSLIYVGGDMYHLIKCEEGETAFFIKAEDFAQCIQRLNEYIFKGKFSINPADIDYVLNKIK